MTAPADHARRALLLTACVGAATLMIRPPASAQTRGPTLRITPDRLTPAEGAAFWRVAPDPAPAPGGRPDPAAGTALAPLLALVAQGRASGWAGDFYDNRDRGHSRLAVEAFPGLAATDYDAALQRAGLDYGLNERLMLPGPTIGNSSTAVTGVFWRSLPRLAMTRSGGATALARHWRGDHLYVFPEHRDHDPGRGDLLPANTPYVLISQGSSGSDQALLTTLAILLGALAPDVKALLRARGLIAPTLQALFRRTRPGIASEDDYLSAAAHPSAFPPTPPDHARLVAAAQALTVETVPPLVALSVLAEDAGSLPTDPFSTLAAERLFDTPAAVARIARGPGALRRYALRARAETADGRPARVLWRVLRGRNVRLSMLDPAGETVIVEAPWQEAGRQAGPAPGPAGLTSTRVDVAAFADAGAGAGPPAFFSVDFPADRAVTRDAAGRLVAVDFTAGPAGAHVDPALHPLRDWRDAYAWAPDGALLGWVRTGPDGALDFCRNGHEVLNRDALGRPAQVRAVAYALDPPGPGGRRALRSTPGPQRYAYRYADPADLRGVLRPAPDR